jgi:hypothetical protein
MQQTTLANLSLIGPSTQAIERQLERVGLVVYVRVALLMGLSRRLCRQSTCNRANI